MFFDDKSIEDFILSGVIEVKAIDSKTGDFLYGFTEKLKTVDPKMFGYVNEVFYQATISLWEKGFVDINFEEEDPSVFLTGKGMLEENLETLSDLEFAILESMVTQAEQNNQ